MGEVFGTLFIFVAIIVIAAALFVGWVVITLLRGLGRAARAVVLGPTAAPPLIETIVCTRASCHCPNLPRARFCRRCGYQIEATKHTPLHAAATWH